MAIACSDGDDITSVNKSTYIQREKELAEMSPHGGSLWARVQMTCIHYPLRAHYRFPGPWKANTSHPVLFIGNTADPVTPGINAINMAKGYEGAVALVQNSSGHCAVASTYSECTVKYVRDYFKTGEMPPPGVTCEADEQPFGPGPDDVLESVEIQKARERHATIGEALMEFGGLMGGLPRSGAVDALLTR
jgi:hypothetical protein